MKQIIGRVLNNNVILVKDNRGTQSILVGKGVGFGAHVGDVFTKKETVELTFTLADKQNQANFKNIVDRNNPQIVALIEEELTYIQKQLGKALNENVHSTLTDHVCGAIDRYKKGIVFKNPFNDLMKMTFKVEYKLAEHLVDRVNETYDINMNENEVSIVALHISAAANNEGIQESSERVEMIQRTVEEICRYQNVKPDTGSFMYQRMLMHCKLAYDRIYRGETIKNELTSEISSMFPEEMRHYKKFMMEQLEDSEQELTVPDDEVAYLVLYARRILK